MTRDPQDWVGFIDGPTPFDPLSELIRFRNQCAEMVTKYPRSEAWRSELERVSQDIQNHADYDPEKDDML